jgi:hypothetical protein
MSSVLDHLLVAAALLASAGYALFALGPKSLRRWMLGALARGAAGAPAHLHLSGIARRLTAAASKAQAACGGCESCAAEPASPGGEPRASAPEVRVPLSQISRRR